MDATPARDSRPALDLTEGGPSREVRRHRPRRGRRRALPGVTWHGPVPQVGRSLTRTRAAAAGRWSFATMPAHAPVRVDVVPVIHQRAHRGAWAARWSRAQLVPRENVTDAPATLVRAALAELLRRADTADELHTRRGGAAAPPSPPWPEAAASTAPTRGPDRGPPGALATAGAAPP